VMLCTRGERSRTAQTSDQRSENKSFVAMWFLKKEDMGQTGEEGKRSFPTLVRPRSGSKSMSQSPAGDTSSKSRLSPNLSLI
jgi:hypothetical protein